MTIGHKISEAEQYSSAWKCRVNASPFSLNETMAYGVMQLAIDAKRYCVPLYGSSVKAGFPSPAEDYAENTLDLNQYLIKHPAATFFVRASGHSMINAGIHDKDLLIVDRSLEPVSGKVVIAVVNGEFTVKRFQKTTNGGVLIAENPDFPPICLSKNDHVHIWGVVIHVIHSL